MKADKISKPGFYWLVFRGVEAEIVECYETSDKTLMCRSLGTEQECPPTKILGEPNFYGPIQKHVSDTQG